MTTNYIDITVADVDKFSVILQKVHHCNWEGYDLAVSFPRYNDNIVDDFGNIIRIFGSANELSEFYLKLVNRGDKGGLKISEIQTPPETSERVAFVRDRNCERNAPSNIRRRMKRAEARGEVYTPKELNYPTHRISVPSVSTHGPFALYIRKDITARDGGSQYGLGKLVPSF